MDTYTTIKALHVLTVIALVGPLILTPGWLFLLRHKEGQAALHKLHQLTGISGWLVLLSGGLMVFVSGGGLLHSLWLQISLLLFIAIQTFDHVWADKQEEKLEQSLVSSDRVLKTWLITKVSLFCLIAILMVIKVPS